MKLKNARNMKQEMETGKRGSNTILLHASYSKHSNFPNALCIPPAHIWGESKKKSGTCFP